MNTTLIRQTAIRTLEGSIAFPQVVAALLEAGVEYYLVNYVTLQKSFHGPDGDTVITPITYENLPPIAPDFDAPALRANILDSQQNHQPYRAFTERALRAGVQSYFAFLRGKRVTYIGRQGDSHTEWFPGAKPLGQ